MCINLPHNSGTGRIGACYANAGIFNPVMEVTLSVLILKRLRGSQTGHDWQKFWARALSWTEAVASKAVF